MRGVNSHSRTLKNDVKNRARMLVLGALAFVSIGCGARFGATIAVPSIPPTTNSGRAADTQHEIFVDQFADSRENPEIVTRGEEKVKPASDVATPVRAVLEQSLRNRGFSMNSNAPIVINGEVKQWSANVIKGFPGKVDAEAKVYIEVLDPTDKRIYSGNYQGSASRQDARIDENEVQLVLGTAMSEALNQVVTDKQLIDLLLSY